MSPTKERPPKRIYHLLVTTYKEDQPPERIQVHADTICQTADGAILKRGGEEVAEIQGRVFAWWIEELEA